jgi:hypothetical protein
MKVTTSPASRFVSEGQTVEYTVKADGATELAIGKQTLPGIQARLTDVHTTGDGVEARVLVEMKDPKFV